MEDGSTTYSGRTSSSGSGSVAPSPAAPARPRRAPPLRLTTASGSASGSLLRLYGRRLDERLRDGRRFRLRLRLDERLRLGRGPLGRDRLDRLGLDVRVRLDRRCRLDEGRRLGLLGQVDDVLRDVERLRLDGRLGQVGDRLDDDLRLRCVDDVLDYLCHGLGREHVRRELGLRWCGRLVREGLEADDGRDCGDGGLRLRRRREVPQRSARDRPLAERLPSDGAARGRRELVDELDLARNLLGRKRLGHEVSELGLELLGALDAGLHDDVCAHEVTAALEVADADGNARRDGLVTPKRALHLGRPEGLAASGDEILGAADEPVEAVVVDGGDVARHVPVAAEGGLGLLRRLPVPGEERRRAAPQGEVTDGAGRELVPLRVDDRDLLARERQADRPVLEAGFGAVGDHHAGLGLGIARHGS